MFMEISHQKKNASGGVKRKLMNQRILFSSMRKNSEKREIFLVSCAASLTPAVTATSIEASAAARNATAAGLRSLSLLFLFLVKYNATNILIVTMTPSASGKPL